MENEAARLGMEGFGSIIDTPRIRLALHRRDLAAVRRLFSAWTGVIPRRAVWYFPAAVATQLDALAALGETARLEEEAAKYLEEESALQLFALRALGIVRGDRALLRQAAIGSKSSASSVRQRTPESSPECSSGSGLLAQGADEHQVGEVEDASWIDRLRPRALRAMSIWTRCAARREAQL